MMGMIGDAIFPDTKDKGKESKKESIKALKQTRDAAREKSYKEAKAWSDVGMVKKL